jgi:hypothetical protein
MAGVVLGLAALIAPSGAHAASVVSAGYISCAAAGTISFVPAVTTASQVVVMTVTLQLTRCDPFSETRPATSGVATISEPVPSADCITLLGAVAAVPLTGTVTWGRRFKVAPSVFTFSGMQTTTNAKTDVIGYAAPGSGGTASVTGSFAGRDGGALSHGSGTSTQTLPQLVATCDDTGLTSVSVKGRFSLG